MIRREHTMTEKIQLPKMWEVPDVFRERLGDRSGRQRAMFADGHLLLILHKAPQPNEDQRVAAFFWRQPDGNWMASEQGSGLAALNLHVDEYESVIDHWETQEYEAVSAASYFEVLDRLAPVHRAVRNLHAVLQDARKQVNGDRNLINLRDRAYDLERRAELLYAGAKNSLDFAVAQRSEEQSSAANRMAQSAHRLNLLAAFFFPLATLSAVFGVNLKFGLEDNPPPWGFLVLVGVGLFMGLVLAAFVTPRRNSTP